MICLPLELRPWRPPAAVDSCFRDVLVARRAELPRQNLAQGSTYPSLRSLGMSVRA